MNALAATSRVRRAPCLGQTLRSPRPAEAFREQARDRVTSGVEMTALALFERAVLEAPTQLLSGSAGLPADPQKALYLSTLLALQGLPSSGLNPALVQVLDDFRVWQPQAQPGRVGTLGDFSDQVQAARVVGSPASLAAGPVDGKPYHIPLLGSTDPIEVAHIQSALQEMVRKTNSKALHLVKEIYLRPFLAHFTDPQGQPQLVDGLAHNRQVIGILQASARDPQAARRALFHEAGHELDHILSKPGVAYRSSWDDNPFGQGECVSEYARTNATEDFAETHQVLIEEWDQIRECPDLFLHARGQIGEKLAWIWQKGYREELPPPSQALLEARRRLGEAQLQKVAQGLRSHWPHPQGPQETWLAEHLHLQENFRSQR